MAAPAVSAPATTDELIALIRASGIHPDDYLDRKLAEFDLPDTAGAAAAALVRGGLLTAFQAKLLLAGRHRGFRLGTYVIKDQLGRGGMGTVYLAEHVSLRRKVAVKVLSAGGTATKAGVERFLREARAAAALDHPNIVRVFDVLQHGPVHYLVMEYVDGRTLESLAAGGGAVAPGRAVGYISQAAAGLQHAHEKGFVHRDIKPGNLMLAKDGTVKVLDMGLARSVVDESDRVTEQLDDGAVVGTADYISPEQAMNAPDIDIRADVYSLGATLYALVAGRPPFAGTTSQVLMQHQMKPPPALDEFDRTIAPGLAAVVAKMLAKKPADRYATPAEVIAALAPWLPNRDGAQKVMAGLSASQLGQSSSNLRITLDEVLTSGSTRSLGRARAARTRRAALTAGAAVGLLALGGVGYAVLGGAAEPAPVVATAPPAPVLPTAGVTAGRPPAGQPPQQPTRPQPAAGGPATLFAFDAGRLPEFRVGLEPNRVVGDIPGGLPGDGFAGCWQAGSTGELVRVALDGGPALGIASRTGVPSAQFVLPLPSEAFDPGREYLLRVTYQTRGEAGGCVLVQHLEANYAPVAEARLAAPAGGWQTAEVRFKRPAGGTLKLAVQSSRLAASPGDFAYVRSVELLDPTAAKPLARLDPAELAPFSVRVRGREQLAGTLPTLPKGFTLDAWKADTEAEYGLKPVDGRPAVGITTLSGPATAQLAVNVEHQEVWGMGLTLTPGRTYELRIEYKTAGGAHGQAYFQSTDFKPFSPDARADLPDTSGGWRAVAVRFTRGDQPCRALIDNLSVGGDKTLYLRAVELVEAGAAAATPPAPPPPARSAAAVGARVLAVDLSGLSPFRAGFADGKADGGLAGIPGVGWYCWKKGSVAEFRAEATDAGPALGVTNLNDEVSSQVNIAIDGSPALQPGRRYVLRVEYKAANDAAGAARVRTPDYVARVSGDLTPGGGWRWAEVPFSRGPEPLHAVVENTAVGEGNTLWVRKVEVCEAK